jgi:hypothetical protein
VVEDKKKKKKKNKGVLGGLAGGLKSMAAGVGIHIGGDKPEEEKKEGAPEAGAPAAEGAEEKKKEEAEKKEEDLKIVSTDCIVFASNSKFQGDATINAQFTSDEANAWFNQQYVVQVCQTENHKLVLSMRRAGDIEKSLIAVQSKGETKPVNDVVLAYHKDLNLNPS